jgi:large subunit ribosomal protein L25
MKTIQLKGEKREGNGTSDAKALRAAGKVPCVMYGNGENLHFSIYEADFKNLVYTPNVYKVKLDIDGSSFNAILQDMQFHPVSEAIMHADFMAVAEGRAVVMDIPIRVVGNSPGVRAGGKLVKKINKLRVRGLLSNLPDYIDVNIDTLEIGQSVKVKNLTAGNFEMLDAKENAIVSCKTTRALMQAAAEAAK